MEKYNFSMGLINHLVSSFLLLVLLLSSTPSYASRRSMEEHHHRFQQATARRLLATKAKVEKVFYPSSYDADPSGVRDSSDAIQSAVNDACGMNSGKEMMPGIRDLGGVVIDLQGGSYNLSKPIIIPQFMGNILIQGGTFRASDSFLVESYLLELRPPNTTAPSLYQSSGATYHYEGITIQDVHFDANHRGGGLVVSDAVRTRVKNCFFSKFGTIGILVERGHETFITDTFLGQNNTAGGDPNERSFSGVAIDIASNDNVITDVAIFSAATGVILRGQANILTGVHCYNKATHWGGVGVLVKLPGLTQTRISNSYMDYTGIVVEDPVQFHVTNTFFFGNANIVLKSVKGQMSGVNIVDNMFSGENYWVPIVALNETSAPFTKVDQVVVQRNNVDRMLHRSTVSRRTVAAKAAKWEAEFNDLVFPNRIYDVQYSLFVRGQVPRIPVLHSVTNVSNNVVVIESDKSVDGVVSVVVDQNGMVGEVSGYA